MCEWREIYPKLLDVSIFFLQAVTYFGKAVRLGRETESDDLTTFLVNLGMSKIKQGLKVYEKKNWP